MRAFIAAVFLGCAVLHASILPTLHLDSDTLKAFQQYAANFEKNAPARFISAGYMWIDDECCAKKAAFLAGKPVVEPRNNDDVANGSIHHFSGVIRVDNATIESIRHLMEDYPNYVKYFKPDLGTAVGTRLPDSTPDDEHFKADLTLVQTTLWINVTFDTVYDTHYRRLGTGRWMSRSVATSIKEMRDPKNAAAGFFAEGDDHGFLWRTQTYWFARERNGGLDLEADSVSLSRPNVTGFAWWGTKRSHDAVEKMLRDAKAAIDAGH